MKRFFALILALCGFTLLAGTAHAADSSQAFMEKFTEGKDLSSAMDEYAPKEAVTAENYFITGGAKTWVGLLVTRLTQLGALLAVVGIVYSGFLMVTSGGDDEKSKNGKTGLIWSAAGFLTMIMAGPAVNAIINTFYATGSGK